MLKPEKTSDEVTHLVKDAYEHTDKALDLLDEIEKSEDAS